MGYSRKIILNGHEKSNGCRAIYLRIIIDRKKKLIPLEIEWPKKHFDLDSGLCKDRFRNDKDRSDYNLIITDAVSKANEIFKYFRLTNQQLTITKFWKEYNSNLSKTSFTDFYSQKAKIRLKDREITNSTYNSHMRTHRKLEKFCADLRFADFNENWAYDFEAFLKKDIELKKADGTNTRWLHHKNVKVYLKIAKKEHIKLVNPYDYFAVKKVPGRWKSLQEDDIQKLWKFYENQNNKLHLRLAVRGFLFMCYTGIRISDLRRVERDWLTGGFLSFLPLKTKKYGRLTKVPLSQKAMLLWNDAVIDNPTGYLFRSFSEQKFNKHMKDVMTECEITNNIHNHVGRHTFITMFLKKGGSLDIASKYAGHASVNQTMKYNHPDDDRLQEEIKLMDEL